MKIDYNILNMKELRQHFVSACENGDLKLINYILTSRELNLHPRINDDNYAGLNIAQKNNHFKVIKYLLEKFQKTDYISCHTAYWHVFKNSCKDGNAELLNLIVELPYYENQLQSFQSGLVLCSSLGHIDLLKVIINKTAYDKTILAEMAADALKAACFAGQLETVKYLLTPNLFNKQLSVAFKEYTPLMQACAGGHIEVVKYLLALPELTPMPHTIIFNKALQHTVESWNMEVLEYLLVSNTEKFTINDDIFTYMDLRNENKKQINEEMINYFIYDYKMPFTNELKKNLNTPYQEFIYKKFESRDFKNRLNEEIENNELINSNNKKNKI